MNTREQQLPSDALYTVGTWLLGQGRDRDASDLFRVFTMAVPRDERAWLGLSECHVRLGQPSIALEMAGAGVMLAAQKTRLFLMRARILVTLDRDDEAEVARERALDAAGGDDELEALVHREGRAS